MIAPQDQPASRCRPPPGRPAPGDPVLFAAKESLPEPTAEGPEAARRRCRSTCSGPPRRSPRTWSGEIDRVAGRVRRVSGEDPVTNAIEFARYADGDFGWNINDPGHGFVIARADRPLDAAAAAPLSASGTWGPLLLTDAAEALPGRAARLPARPQAGLSQRPDPGLLQPRLADRRPGGDRGQPAGGDRRPRRAGQDRRAAEAEDRPRTSRPGPRQMSEAERPELLAALARGHGRGHPRPDRRRHPALRAAGPQPRPPPDRAAAADHPARIEGERKITELEDLARHSGEPRGRLSAAAAAGECALERALALLTPEARERAEAVAAIALPRPARRGASSRPGRPRT